MRRTAIAILLLMLAGCGNPTARVSAPAAAPLATAIRAAPTAVAAEAVAGGGLALDCTAPTIAHAATLETLRKQFGDENVTVESKEGDEGSYDVAMLFAKDPTRRAMITFEDGEKHLGISTVRVDSLTSSWVIAGGIKMGDGIAKVEALNGKSFELWPFIGDSPGNSASWNEGAIEKLERPNCTYNITFKPEAEVIPKALHNPLMIPTTRSSPMIRVFGR